MLQRHPSGVHPLPDCVAEDENGQLLTDSADHRSHMAYAVLQGDGTKLCPDTHPNPVATLTMEVKFKIGTTSGTVMLLRPRGPSGVYNARRLLQRLGSAEANRTGRELHQRISVH